jgi:hypothetical protein
MKQRLIDCWRVRQSSLSKGTNLLYQKSIVKRVEEKERNEQVFHFTPNIISERKKMKASRAPGPVQSTYVKMHQQKKEPKAAPKKGGGVVETAAGGKLNKFKDLDDIPDFPAGDDFDWGDNNSNNNNRREEVDEEVEDDRHWNAHPDNYNSNQQYNRNQYEEDEDEGEQDAEYYQPPSYSQQQQPPPLPAQQLQNNKNNRQSPRPAVQSSSEPKNSQQTNIQQQSKPSVPQKKGSPVPVNKTVTNPKNRGINYRDEDEDDDGDNNGYYQHNLPKHANITSNNKNEKDINSIPLPKKKHEYQEGGHPLQINHQMNAPPPLPYEQAIESPPKVVPEKEKLFYSKEPRKVEYR